MGKKESKSPSKPSTTPKSGSPTSTANEECHPPCTITSKTFATSPADRARTKIGVGEEVILVTVGNSAVWTKTGGGTLDPDSGTNASVAFTAGEAAESVTIKANHAGCGCSNSLTFTVVQPSGWSMKRAPGTSLEHRVGRPDCGWQGIMYLQPNDVNFYRTENRELDSRSVATGSYHPNFHNLLHGNYPGPDFASGWFVVTQHSDADGSTDGGQDHIYSGDSGEAKTGTAVPFNVGDLYFPITMQWRVIGGATIFDFPIVRQEHEIFSDGKCESRKGGNTEFCMWNDPTSP